METQYSLGKVLLNVLLMKNRILIFSSTEGVSSAATSPYRTQG